MEELTEESRLRGGRGNVRDMQGMAGGADGGEKAEKEGEGEGGQRLGEGKHRRVKE
jgi:hypothetical protein